ncbi:MAG: RDD family protein [Chitinophagales bacterium]|nr:RDD family protein [Chitinophagales bacterium]MDW8418820.1 RDD family protein [Chitinophagales bacterium]
MSVVQIPTNFNITLEFELAGMGRRLVAYLADLVICIVYIILVIKLIERYGPEEFDINMWGMWMTIYFPVVIYDLAFETLWNGQSPGKKLMSIRVVRLDGGRPSFTQYATRWLLRVVDFSGTLWTAGFLTMIISRYNQRIGDLAAGTLVISTRYQPDLSETLFVDVAQNYIPKFPMVMQLSDKDINTIKRVLEETKRSGNPDMLFEASEKLSAHLKVQPNMLPRDFLETLIKDYNYLSTR